MSELEDILNIDHYTFKDSEYFLENGVDYKSVVMLGIFDNGSKIKRVKRDLIDGNMSGPTLLLSHGTHYDFDEEVSTITNLLNTKRLEYIMSISLSCFPTIHALKDVSEPANVVMLLPWLGKSSLAELSKRTYSLYDIMYRYHLKRKIQGIPIKQLRQYLFRDDFEANPQFVEEVKDYLKPHNISAILFSTDFVVNVNYNKMILSKLEIPFEVLESKPGIYLHGAVVEFEELKRTTVNFFSRKTLS